MSKNDEKILILRKQIEEKKEQLKKLAKFNPVTNCSIELDSVRYNLNTLTNEQLILLLVKLNMYKLSVNDLKINDFNISGYKVDDWIEDIKSKLEILNQRNEQNKLKQLESKLTKMLSEEKKTELEIEEIANILNL